MNRALPLVLVLAACARPASPPAPAPAPPPLPSAPACPAPDVALAGWEHLTDSSGASLLLPPGMVEGRSGAPRQRHWDGTGAYVGYIGFGSVVDSAPLAQLARVPSPGMVEFSECADTIDGLPALVQAWRTIGGVFRNFRREDRYDVFALLARPAGPPLYLMGGSRHRADQVTLLAAVRALQWHPPAPTRLIIDFYGLHRTTLAQARAALGLTETDTVPDELTGARARLEAIDGVRRAAFSLVCCEAGKPILYVGLVEEGAPTMVFAAPPTDTMHLPEDMRAAGEAFTTALESAIRRGAVGEDQSQGHALSEDSALRAVQYRFVEFAATAEDRLRAVLHGSADAGDRALAAQVLGYVPDKRAAVPDLVQAMRDPDEAVRNNAMRALWLIAGLAQREPDRGIHVSAQPFIALLNSPEWGDRNKASLALAAITASRDSAALSLLKQEALPALLEMARWRAFGHAFPALQMLGRLGGLPEDAIMQALLRQDRDQLIAAGEGREFR